MTEPTERDMLRERIGVVIDRWYHLGLIRFSSRDDGGDDLILRDQLVTAALAARGYVLSRAPEPLDELVKVLTTIRLQMDGPYITLINRDAALVLAALSTTPPAPVRASEPLDVEGCLAELAESPLPGARYAYEVVRRRFRAALAPEPSREPPA